MNQFRCYCVGVVYVLLNVILMIQVVFDWGWLEVDVVYLFDGFLYFDCSEGNVDDVEFSFCIDCLIWYSEFIGMEGIIVMGLFFGEFVK